MNVSIHPNAETLPPSHFSLSHSLTHAKLTASPSSRSNSGCTQIEVQLWDANKLIQSEKGCIRCIEISSEGFRV